ncbi:MAG: hypothetical protein WD646_00280 [Actinomycetota bacterium]
MSDSAVDSKIRERGHWWFRVRPSEFREQRIEAITSLLPILERCSVSLRGWDFPHVGREGAQLQLDYIEQGSEWGEHLEYWRFYKSGQFIDRLALRNDWMDQAALDPTPANWQPGVELGVGGTVFSLTEFCEFASRLAITDAGGEAMRFEVQLRGLRGRRLKADDPRRAGFMQRYEASIDAFPFSKDLTRDELASNSRELALEIAGELFQYFGWQPSRDLLQGIQDELRW